MGWCRASRRGGFLIQGGLLLCTRERDRSLWRQRARSAKKGECSDRGHVEAYVRPSRFPCGMCLDNMHNTYLWRLVVGLQVWIFFSSLGALSRRLVIISLAVFAFLRVEESSASCLGLGSLAVDEAFAPLAVYVAKVLSSGCARKEELKKRPLSVDRPDQLPRASSSSSFLSPSFLRERERETK